MELVFFCCDFGRKLEGLRLLLKNQDFLPSSDGKKRGVFSLLQRRIAPRSVRLDTPAPEALDFLTFRRAEQQKEIVSPLWLFFPVCMGMTDLFLEGG